MLHNYNSIKEVVENIKKGNCYSWLYNKKDEIKGIIISPDTDGFISALFLNEVYGWEVVGFYDGKVLTTLESIDFKNNKEKYAFIDVEILREGIKSIGHHILLWDSNNPPELITSIQNEMINPNNWRGMCANKPEKFKRKYPFGTFHLLVSLVYSLYSNKKFFNFSPKDALIPSIFIDGVFKNLFNYPENCLDWLKYLTNNDSNHPLEILLNYPTSIKDLTELIKDFLDELNKLWTTQNKDRKGKITLSNKKGELVDIKKYGNEYYLDKTVGNELSNYLEHLANRYNWNFNVNKWNVLKDKLEVVIFDKKINETRKKYYDEAIKQKPISLAITSKNKGLQYTIDNKNIF
ncbi:MAG: hypothetical protein GXN95_01825 [Methanococci archaeon]|nr:hypothetical protein [Methanococci archaeon]